MPFGEARTKDYSRILGSDDKTGYTLDGCLRTRETQSWGGTGGRQRFYVGQVVKDLWFDKGEAIEAEMVDVEIDHLLAWTDISGLSEDWTASEAAGGAVTEWRITGVRQEPRGIDLGFGQLQLRHVLRSSDDSGTGLYIESKVIVFR